MKNAINTARVEELKRKNKIKKIKSFIPSNFILGSVASLIAMFWVFAYIMSSPVDANVEICKQLTPEQECEFVESLGGYHTKESAMTEKELAIQSLLEAEKKQQIIKRLGE